MPLQNKFHASGGIIDQVLDSWIRKNKQLLEILLDAYCVVDRTNRVVDFNVAFSALCGETHRRILKTGDFCKLIDTEFCPGECPAKQVLESKKSIRLDELKGVTKAEPDLRAILSGVPILDEDGSAMGVLVTIRNVSAEDALQKKYLARKEESVTDGLTHLYNKTFVEEMSIRAVRGALRDISTFSLVMSDIDHFKQVNDVHGHPAGDYVLTMVAQLLKGEVRGSDIVGRFGGEEFMAILQGNNISGAAIFAERFRNKIETTEIHFMGKHIPLTISVGTATFDKKWTKGVDSEQLAKEIIHQADQALYYAKRNGRNQLCQYENISVENKKRA